MWLDETDLVWSKKDRNIYTAHEILQINPLINRQKTYEKFLKKNSWVFDFWQQQNLNKELLVTNYKEFPFSNLRIINKTLDLIETIFYYLQYSYMKPKMTRELVTKKKAIFHPRDWGSIVLSRLGLN
jgi:hypothetical protein